ncbi:MAG: hypothetical protein HLUCCO06_02015, partial [Halomonas sp. HL-93]
GDIGDVQGNLRAAWVTLITLTNK